MKRQDVSFYRNNGTRLYEKGNRKFLSRS